MKIIIFILILILANIFALLIHSKTCNDDFLNDPKIDQKKFQKAKKFFKPSI